jgi:hypothetical protein
MSTLKEFLTSRAEIERERASERIATQQEWRAAVQRLIEKIAEWLRDADELNLLKIEDEVHELREANVGVYIMPGLVIRLETEEARVVPIGRNSIGPAEGVGITQIRRSFGRVDLKNAGKKYMLFRTQKDPCDHWVIFDDETYTVREFNRQSFDEAMQSLLQ